MVNPVETIKEPLPGNLLPLHPQELDNSASHTLGYGSPHTQGIHNALEESRWQRDFDHVTLSTARPWQTGLSALPNNVIRQLLGMNPFNTSYFALYRPLKDFKSRALLFAAVILALAAGVPLPIIGVVFGKIINSFPPTEDELITRLSQLMGIAAAYFVLTWGWAVTWGIIGEKVSRGLREELVERALGMELAFYDTEAPDMTSVLTDKTQTIQLGTSEKVGLFVQSVSYFVAAFTVGFILDARLTGILFAGVIPTMLIIVYTGTKVVSKMSKKAAEYTDQAATIAESAIRGVQVVQAFGISQSLANDYEAMLRKAVRYGVRKSLAGAAMLGLVFFTAYAANALAFWEGRRLQEERSGPNSEGSAGTIYAVVFLILDASFVMGSFGPFIQTFALAAAAGSSIFAILDRPESHINIYSTDGDKVSEEDMQEDITFQDVIFVYPARPAVRVLDSLSITLKAGQVNGVVGSSGSGKSTLASLLVRLYDPTSGQVKIGSKDIRRFNIAELRKHVAVVEQESVLFSGTILENVAFGLPDGHDLSVEDIEKRCRESLKEAHCDFVEVLPDGIHSLIGGKGASQLSGGQKQRLCLARALVRRPTLLILDEYTSAMDATSESIVLEALRQSSREHNRTTIVIAHRLATVKDADNILVMTDGGLVEEGTHEKLIESDGVYAGLVRAQGFDKKRGTVSRQASWETNLVKSPIGDMKTKQPTDEVADADEIAHPGKKFSAATLVRRCLSLSKPESPMIALGLLASTVSGAIIVGEAIVFGNLVNLLNSPRTPETNADANFFCLIFFILALIALFAYTTSGSMFGIVSERLILRIQYTSLQTILSQDMSWFAKAGNSPHLLMSKLSMDAGHIGGLSGVILGTFFSVATSICGGIILAHVVAWRIAVVLLAAVPIMVLAGFARLKVLSNAEERHQSAYGDAAATASEACAAIRTVAILGREHTFLKKYKEQVQKPYKEGMKFTLTANILLAFSLSITYFVYALAYWWGAKNVREGYYSVLDFFIVLPALLFSAQAAGQMFSLSPEITRAQTAAQSIFTLHAQKPTIMPSLGAQAEESSDTEDSSLELKKGRQDGTIEFKDIKFAYPSRPNAMALNGVSLTIAPGTFAAFVGRSGAGKTSSIALIERFFDPVSGEVLIDGQDIRTMSIEQHRARVSLVEQEPDLFPGSIRYNVSLGARPGHKPSDQEIESVCQMCGLHAFIMSLPDAYNTDCGKNGSQLSGGQKQRLAIARALLRNPDILLLDEATSQLDANTEQDLRRAIAAASAGRTTVMVAHRLASIQRADRIFVFDHGKVMERGTHDELVEQGGIYAGMVAAQELS